MKNLSTSIISILLLGSSFWQCQDQDKIPAASPQVYVSADRNEASQRLSNECAFRYTIANSSAQLDNNSQREAIRAGFAMWQKMSPNVSFLEFATSERAILFVRFVNPDQLQAKPIVVSEGLLRGPAMIASALRQESNGSYTILLSNDVKWSTNMLTRSIAYHAGLLLGMATSADAGALMSPVMQNRMAVPIKADSVALNRLYVSPCASYLSERDSVQFKVVLNSIDVFECNNSFTTAKEITSGQALKIASYPFLDYFKIVTTK
ncbi:matrixin family metalloprotease [Spirosoma agri]|uniref:Matrixin family metalloprotease n=1 Tax=Spirosoma agri TaxID=1987381 RepID=A0A6M0IKS6_9BACT|nr:matrixin family metalloprotease [Spirosoma agri]NEU68870.1 matrixin family metalloprotease [Spirosoma agri]